MRRKDASNHTKYCRDLYARATIGDYSFLLPYFETWLVCSRVYSSLRSCSISEAHATSMNLLLQLHGLKER